jgi:hypothetical protein
MVHKTQDTQLKIEQHEPYNKPTLLVDFILLNFIFNLVLAAKGLKLTGHLSFIVINFELTVKYVYASTSSK